jgi:hypothetical protein
MPNDSDMPCHSHNHCTPCDYSCPGHPSYSKRLVGADRSQLLAALEARSAVAEAIVPRFIKPPPAKQLRPKTSAERKGEPVHSGVLLYFPDALAAIARLSKAGNDKHNPGEPLHWARGKSMDQMDALVRHSLTRDSVDPEVGELEAVALAWRALAELQLLEERRLRGAGIMPYSGVTE